MSKAELGPAALPALLAYGRSVLALGRWRLIRAAALVLLGAIVEGFGVMLLVPLLATLLASGGGAPAWAAAAVRMAHAASPASALPVLLAAAALLAAVRAVILWRRELRLVEMSLVLVDAWRMRLMRALAGASWARLVELRRDAIAFALTTDVGRLSGGSDRLLRGGNSLLQLVVQLAVALWLSPKLAALILLLSVVTLPLLLPVLRAAHRYGAELTAGGGKRHTVFSDFLSGLKLAKAHGAEQRYVCQAAAASDALRARSLRYVDRQQAGRQAVQWAAMLLGIAVILLGTYTLHTPLPVLLAMLALVARIVAPAMDLAQGAQALATALPAVAGLLAIEAALAAGAERIEPVARLCETDCAPALALRGVSYRHAAGGSDLFCALDVELAAGQIVALVGPSGSGKTTIADLLSGLVTPQSGNLLVDGVPITDDFERANWRAQTAYVLQDALLFDCSIAENLRWARPEASAAEMWQALEAAEAAGFVRALNDGLDTVVGDRGARLSGGERQRLCLARALLRRPRLLILDEATNALDPRTERRLLDTLLALKGVTILIITHRLLPHARVDRLLRLEGGELREDRISQGQPADVAVS